MAYKTDILTNIYGRRLGLQNLSTNKSGGSRGAQEYLVGAEALRVGSSAETTSVNLHPFGVSYLASGTSSVFTIDPPVPGLFKYIAASSAGTNFVKTANNETIVTTAGSSFTTVKISSSGGSFMLFGLTTAIWGSLGLTTGTTLNASGFSLTTST